MYSSRSTCIEVDRSGIKLNYVSFYSNTYELNWKHIYIYLNKAFVGRNENTHDLDQKTDTRPIYYWVVHKILAAQEIRGPVAVARAALAYGWACRHASATLQVYIGLRFFFDTIYLGLCWSLETDRALLVFFSFRTLLARLVSIQRALSSYMKISSPFFAMGLYVHGPGRRQKG